MNESSSLKRIVLTEKTYNSCRIADDNTFYNNIWLVKNTLYWTDKNGDLHRDDDKPAVITEKGSLHWYIHGTSIRHIFALGKPSNK